MVARIADKSDPSEASHSRPSTRRSDHGAPPRAEERADPSLELVLDDARASGVPEPAAIARLGRYDILGRMAVGGMAEIYLAREGSSVGSSRHVVVKVVRSQLEGDAEFETMFLQEGRVALGLKHPNICHVYEVGRSRGRCFIAMEYVHGVTLHDLLRRAAKVGARVPTAILVKIAAQIAEALHSAHTARDSAGRALGVVHRDVSPHNVMIGHDGVVKLLDFGVAHARSNLAVEDSGTIKGKLGYLAPEQCVGKPVDARSDVFALGVCLWEGLTGRRLFKRATELETLTAIAKGEAPDPTEHGADSPPELAAIVRRALAKPPEERWQSAEELEEALEGYLTEARELVNAARIARFVASLYPGSLDADPELDARPEIVAWLGPISMAPPPAAAPAPPSRWPFAVLGGVCAAALLALGVALWPRAPEVAAQPAEPAIVEVASSAPEEAPSEAVEDAVPSTDEPVAVRAPSEPEEPRAPEAAAAPAAPSETARARRRARRESGARWRRAAPGGFVDDPGF